MQLITIASEPARCRERLARERGMAVLAVMLLLGALAAFVAANGLALRSLQQELRFVEKQQLKKWSPSPDGPAKAPTPAHP